MSNNAVLFVRRVDVTGVGGVGKRGERRNPLPSFVPRRIRIVALEQNIFVVNVRFRADHNIIVFGGGVDEQSIAFGIGGIFAGEQRIDPNHRRSRLGIIFVEIINCLRDISSTE